MQLNKIIALIILTTFFHLNNVVAQQNVSIIPKPQELNLHKGAFTILETTTLFVDDKLWDQATIFKKYLEPAIGFNFKVVHKRKKKNTIEFRLDTALSSLGEEGYKLVVTPEKITLTAFQEKGIFWGIQTLRQLAPKAILREAIVKGVVWEIPCVTITDNPRFKWRGLMLDCSRTFIAKEEIKKYIESMSFFKMNVLHLHLTDDQGWRLEIKKYPELTSIASKLHESFNEPKEYEGFYTQDDIKELIAFALERNIQIVPEIEMPGHTTEVFAVFPELSCKGNTSKIVPWFKGYGLSSEVFCAGKETTFNFLENVLDEVAELFPSEYIHIGGDEAPKLHWKECPKCQKRMKEERLNDENELQSWFIKRIEKHLKSRGKKLIGWDEIIDGGLSESATVMYWRSWKKDVAEKIPNISNNTIMSPTSYSYFDFENTTITTEKVYGSDPITDGMSKDKINTILGVQANFWSHLARTPAGMNRQIFPRLLAMAEIAWTDADKKDWNDFKIRLQSKLKCLDIMGVYYYSEN
jgi:hexosaminidase